MSENVCTACGGSGQQWSGVEYMGQHEIVGCDECWGTGFDDVLAGVDSLRALLAQREAEIEALRELAKVEGPVQCPTNHMCTLDNQNMIYAVPWRTIIRGQLLKHCPDCGTRLQGGEA